MKTFITALFALFLAFEVTGQSVPQQINYQGIARNASGAPLANTTIKIRLSFISSAASVFYTETKSVTTNEFGMYNLMINDGTGLVTGSFSGDNWAGGASMTTEIDPQNGNEFIGMGTTLLSSVPYALEAARPKLSELKEVAISTPSVGDQLRWNGTQWENVKPVTIPAITTHRLFGRIANTIPLPVNQIFVGPTLDIKVTRSSQVFVVSIGATIGVSSGGASSGILYGVCYKRADLTIGPFYAAGVNNQYASLSATAHLPIHTSFPLSGLTPANYQIGLCVGRGTSNAFTISDNQDVNGFVLEY